MTISTQKSTQKKNHGIQSIILAGGQSSRMGQDKALLLIDGMPLIRRIYEAAAPCCSPVYVVSPWCDRYRPVLPDTCRFVTENVTKAECLISGDDPVAVQTGDQADVQVNSQADVPADGQAFVSQRLGFGSARRGLTQGPLVGFSQGLSHLMETHSLHRADPEWVLLLACDLPNIRADVIQQWCDWLYTCGKNLSEDSDALAFLPSHATKGWHPLCGFYRLQCLSSLQAFICQGGRSFQKWLADPAIEPSIHALPVDDPNVLFNCNTPRDLDRLQ